MQRTHLFEYRSIGRHCQRCIETTCAAAARFLAAFGVRSGIGTEEEAISAAGDYVTQRFLMNITFKNRQAEKVWSHAAYQHMVAVKHQVLRRNGSTKILITFENILSRIFGSDVFEYNLKFSELTTNRLHHFINEIRFTTENIYMTVRYFAVDEQWHADFLHTFQYRINSLDVRNTMLGVGRGIGRVKFCGGEYALLKTAGDFIRIQRVGQIAGQQRCEVMACRHSGHDARAICQGSFHSGHWRRQVRHNNRTAKNFAGER